MKTQAEVDAILRTWGFPLAGGEFKPVSSRVDDYLTNFVRSFPNPSKNLFLVGHSYKILIICRKITEELIRNELITRRVNLLQPASMVAVGINTADVINRISSADLNIVYEIGITKLNPGQLALLYHFLFEPITQGKPFIFTSSNITYYEDAPDLNETVINISKPLFELIQGSSNVLDIGN